VIAILDRLIGERVASPTLMHRALDLAIRLAHPVYDCVYLALAEQRNIPLVTADARLIAKLQSVDTTIVIEAL
jgi:predicted nucleic acid-binding protein